jgi:hypothetical protein
VSPLAVLAFSVVYGLVFMVYMIRNFEEFLGYNNYTRSRFVKSAALGLSALTCFCLGYVWLVVALGFVLA